MVFTCSALPWAPRVAMQQGEAGCSKTNRLTVLIDVDLDTFGSIAEDTEQDMRYAGQSPVQRQLLRCPPATICWASKSSFKLNAPGHLYCV